MSSENVDPALPDIQTATPSSVRAVNRSIILGLIRKHQPLSRAELARLTGIFRSSISDIVDELVAEQLVTEERSVPAQRGRVPMALRLNDVGHRVLGLNIRPDYSQLAVAGLSGIIQHRLTFETPTSPRQLVRSIGKAMRRLAKEAYNRRANAFRKVGVAVPGHVDFQSGDIIWAPTHPELNGFALALEISRHTAYRR